MRLEEDTTVQLPVTAGTSVWMWNWIRRNPWSAAAFAALTVLVLACVATLPWTLAGVRESAEGGPVPRYNAGLVAEARTPPSLRAIFGTDALGRSVLVRSLVGGAVSLAVGVCAAALSVCIGTLYGALAGWAGGKVDAVMMRVVDVLYGLPTVLLVVLLAIASDAVMGEYVSRQRARAAWVRASAPSVEPRASLRARGISGVDEGGASPARDAARRTELEAEALVVLPPREVKRSTRAFFDLATLFVAIGGVSWLTMARVVRGQVLSLRGRPFIEAARGLGLPPTRIFFRHLLPNLVGPIVVYATLAVPQAMLQESFLSFLGIGVKPPVPSWGTMAAEGLPELNMYQSSWWLIAVPCVLLCVTLLALNSVGEALREALDPRSIARGQGRSADRP